MKMEKPYKPILVLANTMANYEAYIDDVRLPVALEIDLSSGLINKTLIGKLIDGPVQFLLIFRGVNSGKQISNELSELIRLCLFSKNYIRREDFPVVVLMPSIENNSTVENSEAIKLLTDQFLRQGWPSLVKWQLPVSTFQEQLQDKENGLLLVERIDFDEQLLLQHLFCDKRYIGEYIFFRSETASLTTALEEGFSKLCELAVKQDGHFVFYLDSYIQEKKQKEISDNLNKVLQERLHNAENTIEIIRTKYKADYDILFNWYQKEYEVLPAWYKKLGHIVKVITGKRSFKSLFNDEEKYNT